MDYLPRRDAGTSAGESSTPTTEKKKQRETVSDYLFFLHVLGSLVGIAFWFLATIFADNKFKVKGMFEDLSPAAAAAAAGAGSGGDSTENLGKKIESAKIDDCGAEEICNSGGVGGGDSQKEILRLSKLRKVFDNGQVANDDVSFNVYRGEIFALLGHNGAGKTTMINQLCGFHTPTSGDAIVNGFSLQKDLKKVQDSIAVCPQDDP